MITKVYCPQCKHYEYYTEEVKECMMGRHKEINTAEKNNGLVECKFWESK